MSIINEALKKIESKGEIVKSTSLYKNKKRKGWTIFIFLSLSLTLILISPALFKKQISLLPENSPSSLTSGLSGVNRIFPPLTLTGVANFGEENWAIIDGQIVRQGQFIKGAKVENIFSDRVDLTLEGKRFTLKIAPF